MKNKEKDYIINILYELEEVRRNKRQCVLSQNYLDAANLRDKEKKIHIEILDFLEVESTRFLGADDKLINDKIIEYVREKYKYTIDYEDVKAGIFKSLIRQIKLSKLL